MKNRPVRLHRFIKQWLLCISVLLLTVTPVVTAQTDESSTVDLDGLPDCGFTATTNIPGTTVGAVVYNFDTGFGCVENLDRTFQVASVLKLFIAGAFYEWMLEGRISPTTPITFTDTYWMGGRTACLQEVDLGRSFSARELVELMIYCSDNASTWMITDYLGASRVQEYIDSLSIDGIGPVLPYADVDRIKLTHIDPTWANVPRGLSSRFWRRRWTNGLIPQYFAAAPDYTREQLIEADQNYLDTAITNTATPRAIAEYMLKLRDDRANASGNEALVASLVFNAMLKNQRENTAQAFPGTLLIGAKNGFDTGVTAEVNVVFDDVRGFLPSAMFIIFTQQEDLSVPYVQRPGAYFGVLNTYLRNLSPHLVELLFGEDVSVIPPVTPSPNVRMVRYQSEELLNPCWRPYRLSGYDAAAVPALQSCLNGVFSWDVAPLDESLGVMTVFGNLTGAENRIVLVFTAPNGTPYSYQTEADFVRQAAVYWLHPINQAGQWTLDIYLNLQRIHSETFMAG
ncbi:MAG: serine hydrolase [Anaerolineaceae bacterium]|nr:serine hydrolase [Anaerolineaceae bacterium]